MPVRTVAHAVAAPAAAALALCAVACGGGATASAPPAGAPYVEAVQDVLDPAAELAEMTVAQLAPSPPAWPAPEAARGTVARFAAALGALRSQRLPDPGLRAQRGRLIVAFSAALGRMRTVADDIARRDRAALRADARPFLAALRRLPSDA